MPIKFNLRSLLGVALAFTFVSADTTAHAAPGPVAADVLVVIDESGSMSGEQRWIAEVVPQLDQNLQAFGVGSESQENLYGLIGFGDSRVVPRSLLLGGKLLGSPTEFVQAANGLRVNGGTEDGWRGIEFALDTYPRRSGAVVNIILATDEDRDNTNSSITFNTVQAKLQANRALLNAVVNATIRCADNTSALGMDSTGVGYVADGNGGFTTCTGARAVSGSGTTVANYVNLAVQNGGAVWNLNFLRSGGHYARSFTNALLSIKVEEILNQRPVNDLNAVAQAVPNPAAVAQTITLDGRRSFHQQEGQSIVSWEWDLDNDGIYDVAGPVVTTSFPAEGQYPVRLRVTDDSATPLIDVAELTIDVSSSPLKPTAVAGGPYLFCPQDAHWWLDGRGSVNPDDGQGSVGADTDRVTEYAWDLDNDLVFDDANGALVDVASPLQALGVGDHLIRLRVTDNSLAAFPGLVQSNLSDVSITQVSLRDESDLLCNCLPDLAARPKNTKIQLTWTDNGAYEYVVYRSLQSGGPYEQIAVTDSRYSTYLDLGLQLDTPYYYVVAGRGQDGVETCRSREISATPTTRRLNPSNRAPTFTSTPVTTATEGTQYSYDVDATDPDARDVITYSLAVAPTGMTIDGNTGLIRWAPINAQVGQHAVTVQASDVQGAFTNQSFVITVANVNQAPMIISQPVVSAAETVAYRYAVQAIDADVGDTLTYTLLTAPAGMNLNSQTGEISWTPASGQAGAHTVELQVADSAGAQALQSFVVQVDAQNLAPSIVSVPVVEAIVGVNYQYAVMATDPNAGDILTFALGAFPDGMTIDTATGVINWVPDAAQAGVHEITVVVSDDRNASSAQAFQLTVGEPNLAPLFSTTSLPDAIENVGYVATVAATDPNAGDQIVYSLVSGPAGLVIDAQTGQINWLPRDNQVGANEVQFRATDSGGLFSDITLSIQVQAVNDAPVIVSLAPDAAQPQTLYRYQLTVEDPDAGDTLTYALVQAPAGMTVSAAGLIEWTPPSNADATYPVQVTVTDAAGLSDSQSFTLIVANRDPVIISIPLTGVPERQLYTYQVIAQDEDGDTLSYAVQNAPGTLSINATSGLLQWQTQAGEEGSYPVVITVSDNRGGSATQNITITIDPPLNAAPVITSAPVLEATEDAVYTYQVQAQDSDQDALVFTLASAPQGMSMSTGGLISWTPVTSQIGNNDVTVQVSDGRAQVTQSFTVVVNAKPNLAPQITSAPATSAQVAAEYQYQIAATDPESDALTFGLMSAPAGMTMSVSGLVSWTPAEAQLGTHGVTVRVTDTAGNYSEQSFSISVIEQPNATPVITSTPSLSVVAGALYQYALVVSDADGDALQYGLIQGPSAASVNGAGLLVWQTAEPDVGSHPVVLRVTDSRGAYAEQSFTLVVSAPVNLPPVISSVPVTQAVVGQPYAYTVVADDPENAPLTLALLQGPAGMSMTAFGDISWTPLDTQIGAHAVQVQVSDGTHAVTQSYTVDVQAEANGNDEPLSGDLEISPQFVLQGQSVTIQMVSYGGTGNVSAQLRINGALQSPDASGRLVVSADTLGRNDVELVLRDDVSASTLSGSFYVTTGGDTTPPSVTLHAPTSGQILTAPAAIVASINDVNPGPYQLLVAERGKSDWRLIGEGNGNVTSAAVATLDPSMLINGQYNLLLRAFDASGNSAQTSTVFAVEGDLKVGHFSLTFEEVSIPLSGIPITVNRTYDSRQSHQNLDFGYGWSVDYQNVRVHSNRTVGLGWQLNQYGSFLSRQYCVEPQGSPIVSVTLPDGEVHKFVAEASPRCTALVPTVDVNLVFRPMAGTYSQLQQTNYGLLRAVGGDLVDLGELTPVDPSNFRLTAQDGTIYELDRGFGIRRVIDTTGNSLTYSASGIQHSSGVGVQFVRDAQGRITSIQLPGGDSLNYTYGDAGDLVASADALGNETTYGYLRNPMHYLRDIIDPRGVRVSRNEFDDEGRLIAHIDAEGNRIEITNDIMGRTQAIRDRLGNTTVYVYNERGDVLQETNGLGQTIARTYDQYGNLLSETDAEDNVRTWTYDLRGNMLTETDALGRTRSFQYNSFGNVTRVTEHDGSISNQTTYSSSNGLPTQITDALGNVQQLTYSSSGNLTQIRNALGETKLLGYDARGNLVREETPTGLVREYTYDAMGNRLTETDVVPVNGGGVQRLMTQYEYDGKGRQIRTIDPLGHETRVEYDATGNEVAHIDALGRRTEYVYDARGQQVLVRHPDGSTEESRYDLNGNLVESIDRLGRVTHQAWDGAGRLVEVRYPDGAVERKAYDNMGRIVSETDANGGVKSYEYNGVGNLVAEVDALGHRTQISYDGKGRKISVRDARGNLTRYSYDALDRQIQITHADGAMSGYGYDAIGRKTSETDANGRITQYEYDVNGQLKTVVDALGNRTTYTYDVRGLRTAQTDANGHVTTWAYDVMGRMLTRTLPAGQVEQFTYDAVGNRVTHIDFNGAATSYEYDVMNRLINASYSDGVVEETEYDAMGRVVRVNVVCGAGACAASGREFGETVNRYDARDRLVRKELPGGEWLEYSYDANGNRTELRSRHLRTVYDYDALNRMILVADCQDTACTSSHDTQYSYDAVGNRVSTLHANGTSGVAVFDSMNRVIELVEQDAAGTEILRQQFALDATGRRLAVSESEGRNVQYLYDDVYRLTEERVTDARGDRVTQYSLDVVGNRLVRVVNCTPSCAGDIEAGTTTYEFDDNDRLIREVGASGTTQYSYDANGNTLAVVDPSGVTQYQFSVRNELVSASGNLADGVSEVAYQYDADGIRILQSLDGAVQRFLVDGNREHAQVVAELDGNSTPSVLYAAGDQRISLRRNGQRYTYHADALGSVRALTSDAGVVTDAYVYDGFGLMEYQSGNTANDFLFAGEQYDAALDQYYLRARYYDQDVGRFTQIDPHPGYSYYPITLNDYMYGGGDPIYYVDPSGEMFAIGGISSFGLTFSTQSMIRYGSAQAARLGLKRFLFGNPPKDLGLVGEMILDFAIQSVVDTMLFEGDFKNKGAAGTSAHQGLKQRIQSYTPLPGFRVIAEPFFPAGSNSTPSSKNTKGSLGVDVLIQHQTGGSWHNVLAFDLKIGKGWGKKGIADRIKRSGVDVIQINIHVDKK